MIDALATDIWNNSTFQREFEELILLDLKRFLDIKSESIVNNLDSIQRLVQAATIFSSSSNWTYREAAFRIGVAIHESYPKIVDNTLIEFIFTRMGNFPSCRLLVDQVEKSSMGRLPAPLWLEQASHEEKNTVKVRDSEQLLLTDFQRDLWAKLESGAPIAVSAPTSAGKSFVLQQYILSKCVSTVDKDYIAIYIVPTRALINQVSLSMKKLAKKYGETELVVVQVPIPPSELNKKKIIYVLTQERLQILNETDGEIRLNLLIVDESQVITEDTRGIVLQTVVEKLLAAKQPFQVMFATPLTKNPEIYKSIFGLQSLKSINIDESPVTQNLILLDVKRPTLTRVSVSAILNGKMVSLGEKELDRKLSDDVSVLSELSWEFGKYQKNLVYAGGPSVCEKLADSITKNIQSYPQDQEIREFIEFVKDYVHPEYLLAKTLEKGVAFHYGYMPAILRRTIEELFDEGKLSYLICTSTLLHGVNLPAKNIFMFKPTKGRVKVTNEEVPITSTDFWNLAGRAGRLGRDFQGNVFLINLRDWRINPLLGEKKQLVNPSLTRQLNENAEGLIEFISNPDHNSGQEQGLENAFIKLFNEFRREQLDQLIERNQIKLSDEMKSRMKQALSVAVERITVPRTILERHINISPFRQQEMLDYILKNIKSGKIRDCIPAHPLSNDSYEKLLRLFRRIHLYFEGRSERDQSHKYFALIALRWMRGEPLARIINESYDYQVNKGTRPRINTLIRKIMSEIEQDLRFRYVKYTACYIDLLKYVLTTSGNKNYLESIPPIPLFLEMGASSDTMVSLIGLGFSRPTAYLLSSRISDKNMDIKQTNEWLRSGNIYSLNIPDFYWREIKQLLGIE